MFRTAELRPVSGAPYTPRPWCSRGRCLDSAATAASQRRALFLGLASTIRGSQ